MSRPAGPLARCLLAAVTLALVCTLARCEDEERSGWTPFRCVAAIGGPAAQPTQACQPGSQLGGLEGLDGLIHPLRSACKRLQLLLSSRKPIQPSPRPAAPAAAACPS